MPGSLDASRHQWRTPHLTTLVLVTSVVAIGYFAREILLPFALAVLLSFLLAPLARRFQRWRLGRVGSVILAVALAFSVLGVTGWIVTRQVLDLAGNIAQYEEQLIEKVRSLRRSGSSQFKEVAKTVEQIEVELATEDAVDTSVANTGPTGPDPGESAVSSAEDDRQRTTADELASAFSARPLPVQIVDTTFMPLRLLRDASPLFASLGSLAVTVVFVIFMLLQREDLRDRLIRLAGTSRVYLTTEALDDAGQRVSRYLVMQLIINGTYGLAVGIGLSVIGLPNAILWGLLAMLLRFLPYVGPIVAAVTPIALSLAVFPGWTRPFATAAMFIVLELITNNVLEPWLYGTSTGVSTLGIIVAAVFWTWLWGPVGLVLATPLTVCVTVLARHVPQFEFLNILLADAPPLEPQVRFYQRLLAGDYDEASDVLAESLRSGSPEAVGDAILLPALCLAERDRDAGHLSEKREGFVYESIVELIGDLDGLEAAGTGAPSDVAATADPMPPTPSEEEPAEHPRLSVLCLASEDEADRVASELVGQMLTRRGHVARTAYAPAAGEELGGELREDGVDAFVVSAVAPGRGALQARRVCLYLHRRYPQIPLIVGLWRPEGVNVRTRERLIKTGATSVTTSLSAAVQEIERLSAAQPETEGGDRVAGRSVAVPCQPASAPA